MSRDVELVLLGLLLTLAVIMLVVVSLAWGSPVPESPGWPVEVSTNPAYPSSR